MSKQPTKATGEALRARLTTKKFIIPAYGHSTCAADPWVVKWDDILEALAALPPEGRPSPYSRAEYERDRIEARLEERCKNCGHRRDRHNSWDRREYSLATPADEPICLNFQGAEGRAPTFEKEVVVNPLKEASNQARSALDILHRAVKRHPTSYGQDLIDAMNEGRWKDATMLLIEKVDSLYRK